MNRGRFERVQRHLYRVQNVNADGERSALFYARFRCRLKGEARAIALGSDLSKAKDALKKIEAKDVDRYDFDLDKIKPDWAPKAPDGKSKPFTVTEWLAKYPTFSDVKYKRSLADELRMIRLHIEPFFGSMLLTEVSREALTRYIQHREGQTVIRCGKASKVKVNRGTISNELSCLRRMLRVALREGFKVTVPSFEALIIRTERGGRELTESEQKKVLENFEPWMRRLAEFAVETCLSEGDLLRLTDDMIDERAGIIKPEGGRKKTKVEQVSPLTEKARAVLQEIRDLRRRGAIVANVHGLVFSRDGGRAIDEDMIQYRAGKAIKKAGIKKFVFHNYRNTALTSWARRGINVDVAMKASGHSSVQMHKRYVDLQDNDVANAFGTAYCKQNCNQNAEKSSQTSLSA